MMKISVENIWVTQNVYLKKMKDLLLSAKDISERVYR